VWVLITRTLERSIAANSSRLFHRVRRVAEAQAFVVTVDNNLALPAFVWVFVAFVRKSLERREVIRVDAFALLDCDGVAFLIRVAVVVVVWLDNCSGVLVETILGSKCSKCRGCNADELATICQWICMT